MNGFIRGAWALAAGALIALAGCQDDEDQRTCEDFCGEGSACVGGSCVAVAPCDPACGADEVCTGTTSATAQCVKTLASACAAGCAADEVCISADDAAACVGVCGAGQAWNSGSRTCDATAEYCGSGQTWDPVALKCTLTNLHAAYLDKDFANGPAVTAECIKCHEVEAQQMLGTAHFTWMGTSTVTNQATVGKKNLINNFCVAVPSNEARCVQCHPGYGSAPTKDDAGNVTAGGAAYRVPAAGNIDCLICHANLGASGYSKSPGNWGAAFLRNKGTCFPSCKANEFCDADITCKVPAAADVQAALRAAAMSVGRPTRSNCGFCHFNAGGGDNVKMGDLGSALANPARTVDVHMGSSDPAAPKVCADCHAGASHQLLGTGISIPVLEGGHVTCEGCHEAPHAGASLGTTIDAHVAFVACQTCHIPTFSRTQYTKVDWDWKSAGDKAACQGLPGCVAFDATGHGGEAPKSATAPHVGYDWKKGVSTYEQNVSPVYFWYDGSGTHATTTSGGYGATAGDSEANPLLVNQPSPGLVRKSGARITPFKRMTGTQPALADGSLLIVPHVFGTDGLWTSKADGSGTVPVFAGGWSQGAMDEVWSSVLNYGAGAAGQVAVAAKASKSQLVRASGVVTVTAQAAIAAGLVEGDAVYLASGDPAFPTGLKAIASIDAGRTSFTYAEAGADGAVNQAVVFYRNLPAWKWVETEMYMNLNHEVAPKEQAVACTACHGGGKLNGLYSCTNPLSCRQTPVP